MDNVTRLLMQSSGGKKDSTYVDDVFSTYVYTGNATARSITNGIDLAGEGGMTWIKQRNGTRGNIVNDTARGAGNRLGTNDYSANAGGLAWLSAFNSDGFSIGNDGDVNENNYNFSSWSFRKAPGFFDVVTYTGDGATSRNISHSLGSVPGMMIIKKTNDTANWAVYHRSLTATKYLNLNTTDGSNMGSEWFADGTEPTASVFSVGNQTAVNTSGGSYVAYLFGGGNSPAATARSVVFDASGDYLTIPDSDDWTLGNTFTIEFWVNPAGGAIAASGHDAIVTHEDSGGSNGWYITVRGGPSAGSGNLHFRDNAASYQFNSDVAVFERQWTHCALVCNSGTSQWYVNGKASGGSGSINLSTNAGNALGIGSLYSNTTTYLLDGKISNLRIVKGTAVYTSSFRPPTEPLTNITNTKLLCCNDSSTTGATVSPGTITSHGDPTASIDSPFDDPEGLTFGEGGDQGLIKLGEYRGTGAANNVVNLGWEPQYVMFKNTSSADAWSNWFIYDNMRGVPTGDDDNHLLANKTNAESAYSGNCIDFTPTGFIIQNTGVAHNESGSNFAYIAIRRSDGYVGKPVEVGIDVFNMAYGTSDSTIPKYPSGFVTDLTINRQPASSTSWRIQQRLTGTNRMYTDTTAAESTNSNVTWDFMNGSNKSTSDASTWLAWHWKRHAGFDMVAYKGDGVDGRWIPHSMNTVPEMIWVKRRSTTGQWVVGHKGLNGGTDPWNNYLTLETTDPNYDYPLFYDTTPTSEYFTVNGHQEVNGNGNEFISMLFASIDGISKCGYYTGDNTNDGSKVITTGFQPRFIFIKSTSNAEVWVVLDTLRGIQNGANDQQLYFNNTDAQVAGTGVDLSATGFSLRQASGEFNANGYKYIYYAHA